jgi:ornithine cyclodeaminase/alanine dehydrogenase-like protein (mu-crystallin family)
MSKTLYQDVLRIQPEPYEYLTEMQVHRALTRDPQQYFSHVLAALTEIAHGRAHIELPAKQIWADPRDGGDFRVMPCVVREHGAATKIVKIIGTNRRQRIVPDQITVGKALVLHPEENFVTHILEACLLSSARTGLCAALAIHLLADKVDSLAVIGSGRVGYYVAYYAAAVCKVKRIYLVDVLAGRAANAAAQLRSELGASEIIATTFDALAAIDVLALATTSLDAVCAPPAWGAQLVISLGADSDSQSELDPVWSKRAEIFVDTIDTLRFGDLAVWLKQALIVPDDVSDLLAVVGRNRDNAKSRKPRVFVSTGSALLDNLTIAYILSSAEARK